MVHFTPILIIMKHYSKSPRSIARMVGLGCLLAGASAALNGALLVTESFDYGSHASQGSTKFLNTENGHNGGTGWAGAWEASTANGIRLDVTGTSIDYPSETILESVGGKIHNTSATAGSARELSDPISLDGGAPPSKLIGSESSRAEPAVADVLWIFPPTLSSMVSEG